jgi:uncharacterized protein Yka (UPF0111/DUF47 family)
MFSLQKLFGNGDRFFDLLEAEAKEAQKSAQALGNFLEKLGENVALDELINARRAQKRIYDQISEALHHASATSIEREDIEALSRTLYKIPKTAEKIAERIMIAPHWVKGVALDRQASSLGKATETVLSMIQELRGRSHLQRIKEQNDRLQALEGDADKMLNEVLRNLYNQPEDSVKVIFLKDIYELLERAVDRCRDAGNVINQIALKSS